MDFPWLKPGNVEYFHDGNNLMFMQDGHVHPFEEITVTDTEALMADLELHPEAMKALDLMEIYDPVERLKQYATCYYGDFNGLEDFHNGKSVDKGEYYACQFRGACRHEGRLCGKLQAAFGFLSRSEIRVLVQVAQDKSDKEIAEALFLSVYTVSTHISTIISKIGAHSRAGLVKFAMEKHLL
jgi:DNA-binding CsgD family transcriptional regulator